MTEREERTGAAAVEEQKEEAGRGSAIYRIGVISDTHGVLLPAVFEVFEGVDLILHAGDAGREDVLTELEAVAPVMAVVGNVDGPPTGGRPVARQMSTMMGRVAMTHGHLREASAHEPATLVRYFREFAPQVIVYGHTHLPAVQEIEGVRMFNPGAAGRLTVGGRPPMVGLMTLDEGEYEARLEHVALE